MHNRGRRAAQIIVISLGCLLVIGLAFGLWCSQAESGRAFVARRIEQAVSAAIPGRLQIGKITRFDGMSAEVYDVHFVHPNGRTTLHIAKGEVVLDVGEALQGRLGFERAAADGGMMLISTDPDDRLSFEATVNAKTKPGEPNDPHGGLHYALHNMEVKNFRVHVALGEPIDYRLVRVSGIVTVRRIDTPGVQVELQRMRGDVAEKIAGERVSLTSLDGYVHGKERHVAALTVGLRIGTGELRTRVDYFDRKEEKVKLRIEREKGSEAEAVTWLVKAAASISSDITVDGV